MPVSRIVYNPSNVVMQSGCVVRIASNCRFFCESCVMLWVCVGGDVPVDVSKFLCVDKIPLSVSVGLMEKIRS